MKVKLSKCVRYNGEKCKVGEIVTLTDDKHIDAFKAAGAVAEVYGSAKAANKDNSGDGDGPSYEELKAKAKELGIKGYGKMKKEELIAALKEAEEEPEEE
jgi:hypothetical protein